jgi:hypothetical protein
MAYKDYFQRRVEENAFGGSFGTGSNLKGIVRRRAPLVLRGYERNLGVVNVVVDTNTSGHTEDEFVALNEQIRMIDDSFREIYGRATSQCAAIKEIEQDVGNLMYDQLNTFSGEQVPLVEHWKETIAGDSWYWETFQDIFTKYKDLTARVTQFSDGLQRMLNDPASVQQLAKESGLDKKMLTNKLNDMFSLFGRPFAAILGTGKWVIVAGLIGFALWTFGPTLAKKIGGGSSTPSQA